MIVTNLRIKDHENAAVPGNWNRSRSSRISARHRWRVEQILTRMQAGMLLYMTELLEPAVAIAAFVRFLASMDPDVLYELVVAGE